MIENKTQEKYKELQTRGGGSPQSGGLDPRILAQQPGSIDFFE